MALLAGGGTAQLRRDPGTANAVQGFRASGAIYGARRSTALPFTARFQAGDGAAGFAQASGSAAALAAAVATTVSLAASRLSLNHALAGSSAVSFAHTADLVIPPSTMSAAVAASFSVTASRLSLSHALQAASASGYTLTAALTGVAAALAAGVQHSYALTAAALQLSHALSAAPATSVALTATTLSLPRALAAGSAVAFTSTSALSLAQPLAAATQTSSALQANLGFIWPLAASSQVEFTSTASRLRIAVQQLGGASGLFVAATGTLAAPHPLSVGVTLQITAVARLGLDDAAIASGAAQWAAFRLTYDRLISVQSSTYRTASLPEIAPRAAQGYLFRPSGVSEHVLTYADPEIFRDSQDELCVVRADQEPR